MRERLANMLLGESVQQLNASLSQSEFTNEVLTERLAELELALEDANWMRLMLEGEREFSREGLRRIVDLARVMYIKNPLIKRGVKVKALYIWAQGINFKYKNAELNRILQEFLDDPKNQVELTGHQAQMLKQIDYEVVSNIFFVFFTRPSDGRMRVRSLPFEEITEIICDPEDVKTPWFYVRQWTEKKFNTQTGRYTTKRVKAYYPDWRYTPRVKPSRIGKAEVRWDSPVYHVKTGGMSHWKFGVSQVYAAIDWARAYKEFLEDVASLMRAYSRFAWKRVTKGGKKAIAAEKAKMASTLATSGGTSSETNPSPVTGAMALLGEGTDLQPMQVRGAAISPEDGRRLLLMAAAALDLPETYFGDVSVGTFATAKTMDRPTELLMKEGQTMWTEVFKQIIGYVMLQKMKAGEAKIRTLGKIETTEDNGIIEERIIWNNPLDAMLDIDFPPILEKDIQAAVQAVVTALTLNGQQLALLDEELATRLLLKAMAEDDVDEIMMQLFPEDANADTPALSGETTSEARMREAAREFLQMILAEKQRFGKADSVVKAGNNGHG